MMADGRSTFEGNESTTETSIGNNFSISIGRSENVAIGDHCKVVIISKSKSKGSRKKSKSKIDPKYPVTDSAEPVTIDEILDIKSRVGKQWKELGTRLSFENAELEQMEIDFKDDVSELIYQILNQWQQREANNATKAALAKIFIKMKRGDLSDILALKSKSS